MSQPQAARSRRSHRVSERTSFYHFQRMVDDVAAASSDAQRAERIRGFLGRYEADLHVIVGLLLPHHAGLRWSLGADEAVRLAEALFGTRRSVAEHEARQSAPADLLVAFFRMNGRIEPRRRSTLSLHDAHEFLQRVASAQTADERVRARVAAAPSCSPPHRAVAAEPVRRRRRKVRRDGLARAARHCDRPRRPGRHGRRGGGGRAWCCSLPQPALRADPRNWRAPVRQQPGPCRVSAPKCRWSRGLARSVRRRQRRGAQSNPCPPAGPGRTVRPACGKICGCGPRNGPPVPRRRPLAVLRLHRRRA